MPQDQFLTPQDHRRNLVFNSIHELFWGFGMAFHTTFAVIPLFLKTLGAPDIIVASVAGVFVIAAAVPQIFTAFVGRNIQNLKLAAIAVHFLPLPPLLIAGFIFTFFLPSGPSAWMIYYVCYVLFCLGVGVIFPIWADFLETVHIREKRGTFFGISFAFTFLSGGLGGLGVKKLLEVIEFPANFGYGFFIYSGCIVMATLIFIPYRMKIRNRTSELKTFRQFMSEVKKIISSDHNFRHYIISRILLTANFPAISLYAAYCHDKLQFHISEAGVFTAITVLTGGFSSYAAGWIGNRIGHKTTMVFVFVAYLLALAAALAAQTLMQAYLIFVFLGMGQGGFWTTAMSLIYEFAGDRDKKIYFALTDSLTAPFVLLFILLTGVFKPVAGIPGVLGGISIFILLGILSLIFFTKEPKAKIGKTVPQNRLSNIFLK